MSRLLFYSGSIGLGHVTRDVAIADEIRKLRPDVEIHWLAAPPASDYLRGRGEHLLPEAMKLASGTQRAEASARADTLNLTRFALKSRRRWGEDAGMVWSLVESGRYAAMVGDESYDFAIKLLEGPEPSACPCFVLFDFLGLDRMTLNPVEWVGVSAFNRVWSKDPRGHYRPVFLGELEDLGLSRFGSTGLSRREWAARYAHVVGHALQFDPADYSDRAAVRSNLGYGPEPLALVSVGGTAVGAELLELCVAAFPFARRLVPDLRMVLVAGPRLTEQLAALPEGVELRGFVPRLHEHFAACDVAVVQGGGTSTLELTALGRPFLFFPLEGHCEQQKVIVPRQRRLRAGVMMRLRDTPPELLGRRIAEGVGAEAEYVRPDLGGAGRLAQIILDAMSQHGRP